MTERNKQYSSAYKMNKLLVISFLFCGHWIIQCEAARILAVFPFPSLSHQIVFRPLVQELVKNGHDVTVITTDPAFPKGQTPANLTEIDVHDVSYKIWTESFVSTSKHSDNVLVKHIQIYDALNKVLDAQFQDKGLLNIVKNKSIQFDLLLIEACTRPVLIFSHFYKVPTIQVSSFTGMIHNYEAMGMSTHPILYPSIMRQRLYNLTLWEKITELYYFYSVESMIAANEEKENAILTKRLGGSLPKLSQLYKNVQLLLLNGHPIFERIRPAPPSVVYIGGIHQKPEAPLPKELKAHLDSKTNGVIYFSFGTNVDPTKLPQEKIQVFIKVFSQLPYDVLWKWNSDELPVQAANIKMFKWLPQSDVLRHPNVKLFITQGGLQSTDEAITAGVPLIGIPMLADQWYNSEQYVRHKIGLQLEMDSINEENLKEAITTITGDDIYRRNIAKLRTLINDQPQKPLERAMWWIEYVLRHGGAEHLKAPSANISWWDYLELDLVFTVLGILLAVTVLMIWISYSLYRKVFANYIPQLKIKRT